METRSPNYPDAKRPTVFQDGLEFQDFVCMHLAQDGVILQNLSSKKYQIEVGENLQGFEIKLDNRCLETGQLSIEIAEKSKACNAAYVPSGIYRDDNTWLYIQGNYDVLFIFFKSILRQLHTARVNGAPRYREHELPTIRKFHLPLEDACRYSGKVMWLNEVARNAYEAMPKRRAA